MMTRKHFKAFAESIKDSQGDFNDLVNSLICYFELENPNFDKEKFIKACNQDEN